MKSGRAGGVVNSHEIITGDFTRNTEFRIPTGELQIALQARLGEKLAVFDATALAKALMGDTIYSNMIVFGAAWGSVCVARTCSTSLVPMPKAIAPKAPWVEV